MSYNILNKNVQFQGSDQGTIENIVDTHSTQTIGGNKTITHLTASTLSVSNNLGVGTDSPSHNLHVKPSSGNARIVLESDNNSADVELRLDCASSERNAFISFRNSDTVVGGVGYVASDAVVKMWGHNNHNDDHICIKSDGKVGIGTSSPSVKLHVDGPILSTGGIQGTTGTFSSAITGSSNLTVKGYVSGSSIRGDGAQLTNIPGSAIGLSSGGGIVDSSGLKLGFAGMATETSINNTDTLFVKTGGSIKSVQAQYIAGLSPQAVSSYTNQPNANALLKSTGVNKEITADTNLTFNGSLLTVVGDISGSGVLRVAGDITGSNISLSDASGIAGAGLANASGQLKTNFATLSSATPDVAADSIPFIDSAGDAKCSINTFLTQIAGTNVSVVGNQLAVAAPTTDIDALSALGGTGLHQTQDHFMFSDNGTEKKITFSNLEDAIFANVSGDATIAAGGALTIGTTAVEASMLNSNVAGSGLGLGAGGLVVNVDDSSIEIDSDILRVKAAGITDSMLSDGVATGLAGNGLVASSGVMAVQVQGALKISSDSVGITGSIAGNGLQATGTADAVSSLAVSVDNSTIEINSDSLRLKDNGVTLAKMAGLARGKIIVGDSSGDPTSLTLGSAGQLLVSDGDDLLYRSVGGDATLGADGTLTIAANAVEGSMLNSNVAGSGLDYGSNQLSVDVSDFMADGVDNRVLTATGADAMTGEANLTFDGSLLTVAGTGSATKLRANYTGGGHTDAVFLISGSNTENLFQIMQQGNGYPTSFLAGENHSLYPGLLYNRGKMANGGAISQGNVEGNAGSHTRLTVRKTSIADNTATSIVTITVPNANHAAAIRVFGLANFDNCNYAQSFSFEGSLARSSGSPVDKSFSSVTTTENASITPNFTIAAAGSANTGGDSATQTFDLQLTIDTSDASSSNATIMIELINFNDSGITMAAS